MRKSGKNTKNGQDEGFGKVENVIVITSLSLFGRRAKGGCRLTALGYVLKKSSPAEK
jgi:hypothetical protein